MTLATFLERARKEKWAVGHFNVSELDQMRAIAEACRDAAAVSMIGTSEGERTHFGLREAVAIRDVLCGEFGIPLFLNADHSKSVETAKAAIDAGYDSVHIDLSALPLGENIAGTKEVAEYARATSDKRPATSLHVEGELGYLRGESRVQKGKIEIRPEDLTDPDEAARFVKETGVDRLAIAVGNSHGISFDEPRIDIARIAAVRSAIPENVSLVLHGGSGIPDSDIRAAIAAGISNVHINTELRVAYVDALRASLTEHLDEAAMYKLDASAMEALKKVVMEKLNIFGATNKI